MSDCFDDIKVFLETGKLPEMYGKLGISISCPDVKEKAVSDEDAKDYAWHKYIKGCEKYDQKVIFQLNNGKTPKKQDAEKFRSLPEYRQEMDRLCSLGNNRNLILFKSAVDGNAASLEKVKCKVQKEKEYSWMREQAGRLEEELKSKFDEWCMSVDLKSIFQENLNDMCEELDQKLYCYFAEEPFLEESNLDYHSGWHSGWYDEPLNADDLDKYLEDLDPEELVTEELLAELAGTSDFLDGYILDFALKRNEELSFFAKRTIDASERLYDEILDCFLDEKIVCRLQEKYTADYIEKLLRDNPHYKDVFCKIDKRNERMQEIKESILTRIPDEYKDLYPAARKIKRHFVLHVGPTNSGKTYDAMKSLKSAGSGVYLAPLRLLAFEQFDGMNADGYPCSMITGEEREDVPDAKFTASTIEMLDLSRTYACAVIDEAQMIADPSRGGAWTGALMGIACPEVHICTSENAEDLLVRVIKECGDTYEVKRHKRETSLEVESEAFIFPNSVRKGDALVVFSKRDVHSVSAELQSKGFSCSIIYGSLPYKVRHEEARRFAAQETDVVVCTDAIGMGMNLPISRVVFLENTKFDGVQRRRLTLEEYKQIAGRAGRRGIFDVGYVASSSNGKQLRKTLDTPSEKPERAYIAFPEGLINIDYPLSEILEQWKSLAEKPGFAKANLSEMIKLCAAAEEKVDSKQLLYRLITLPFDVDNTDLLWMWNQMVDKESNGEHLRFSENMVEIPAGISEENLDVLEQSHKVCDLFYAYADRFGVKEDIDVIQRKKEDISMRIIQILKRQKMRRRKCRECGRVLPWNYPYPMCNECHDRLFPKYSSYDEEEDDDYFG